MWEKQDDSSNFRDNTGRQKIAMAFVTIQTIIVFTMFMS